MLVGRWSRGARLLALWSAAILVGACLPQEAPPPDNFVGLKSAAEKIAKERAAERAKATPTPAPTPQPAPAVGPQAPHRLTVQEAILMGMENNLSLEVERFKPAIQRTVEDQQRAVFDPTLKSGLSASRTRARQIPEPTTGHKISDTRTLEGGVEIDQFLPTGTTIAAQATSTLTHAFSDRRADTRVGLTVTQSLLQGYGMEVNLASLRQARLDTQISEYELRGFAEALLAAIEETFWDYSLALRQIDIVTESLKLAEKQMSDTQVRIKFGKLADTELAAAEAEVARRRSELILARTSLARTRLALLRLLNPAGADIWTRDVSIDVPASLPDTTLDDVEAHAKVGLAMRPDLNEARLRVLRGDLDVVRTKNGLLPKLDAFITLGKSGYARSFGGSLRDFDGPSYDATVGVTFEQALGNRDAKAQYQRANITRRQLLESVDNLAQTVQVDVRTAYVEANSSKEQIAATAATRKLQEEVLRSETEKLNVGKSTTFLVAQAQRDLLLSQLAEVQAKVNLLKNIVELFRLEGSLLERRGIAAPGRKTVDMNPPKEWGFRN